MHRTGFSHFSIGAFETSEKANGIPTLRHANLAALRGIRHRERPIARLAFSRSVAGRPQSKAFPSYPQTKKWAVIDKLDQISRVYVYKKRRSIRGLERRTGVVV
jgi:hypothetical protein